VLANELLFDIGADAVPSDVMVGALLLDKSMSPGIRLVLPLLGFERVRTRACVKRVASRNVLPDSFRMEHGMLSTAATEAMPSQMDLVVAILANLVNDVFSSSSSFFVKLVVFYVT